LYDLINNPNLDDSKFLFMYSSVRDYFCSGNVYWYKFDINGGIVALYRINPNKVRVTRNSFNQKIFQYNGNEYDSGNILHIPSRFGFDSLIGKSIFSECNDVFKLSSEIDEFINNSFNNSIGNRLVIDITKEYPNASEEQIQQIKNKFQQNYSGIKNAGKPLVKTGKIDYGKIETDYKDNKANQLVENREFQEKEIAKLFGIPLPLLKGTETTNIESLYILFIENAIHPVATQFEQSINKLIPLEDRSKIYFEYSYNSLLKTSIQTRIDVYAKQLNNGMLSPNEIRRKENLPEIEAGDNHFLPANMMPLTDDIVKAYMANAKTKIQQLNTDSPNTKGNHSNIGDDKGM
jgi:HK97 family phage portal protein